MEAHANAFDRYLRYLMVAACFRGDVAADEHRRLRDCALARDAAGAARVLERAHRGLRRARPRQRLAVGPGGRQPLTPEEIITASVTLRWKIR